MEGGHGRRGGKDGRQLVTPLPRRLSRTPTDPLASLLQAGLTLAIPCLPCSYLTACSPSCPPFRTHSHLQPPTMPVRHVSIRPSAHTCYAALRCLTRRSHDIEGVTWGVQLPRMTTTRLPPSPPDRHFRRAVEGDVDMQAGTLAWLHVLPSPHTHSRAVAKIILHKLTINYISLGYLAIIKSTYCKLTCI